MAVEHNPEGTRVLLGPENDWGRGGGREGGREGGMMDGGRGEGGIEGWREGGGRKGRRGKLLSTTTQLMNCKNK